MLKTLFSIPWETIFWRRGWRKLPRYHPSILTNRRATSAHAGLAGKLVYNTTSMQEELQSTIANERCFFTSRARLFKTSFVGSTGTTYEEALNSLDVYFTPQTNLQFERHSFCQAHQAANEPVDQLITRQRRLGENCEFDKYSLDEAIKDQLIEHCYSTTLRRRLLREKSSSTLNSLIEIARSTESANFQAANIENTSPQAPLGNAHQFATQTEDEEQANFTFGDRKRPCTHGGNVANHKPRTPKCPAFDKTCSQCRIQHHFGRVCLKQPLNPGRSQGKWLGNSKVQYVHNSCDDESYDAFQVSPKQVKTDITVKIEGAPVQVCIDSGATANTIDYATYEAINAIKTLSLKPTAVRLRPYGEDNPAPIPHRWVILWISGICFRADGYYKVPGIES